MGRLDSRPPSRRAAALDYRSRPSVQLEMDRPGNEASIIAEVYPCMHAPLILLSQIPWMHACMHLHGIYRDEDHYH